eukprot:CAMPEP_0178835214 /NCGR_PEP_ID=MMETSP0746-20121128/11506_1 /TAXON_ID=913974 /ORGANISM="Nitzschia punctata, Strain CCMP561" /LENGTH=326 /DNA_ID=CAMNT_0020497771 /DNA_START=41 /DNA_END=1021 /DNA_ORIENTATION=+
MSTNEQQQLQRKQTVLQKSERAAKDMSRRMVCGGLAGCIAKTATNPLERIKMLSQTGEHGLKTDSVMGLYRSIIQNEGVIGLWAGNGANLLRIFPAKAVVFASNDMYQGIFRQLTHTPEHQKLHSAYAFFAGGLAGMSATACTYPLDFARGRISGKLASHARKKEYKGIWTTILLTVRDEGALALYKGVTPTLLGALPYEGIKFGTVGVLEKLFPLPVDVPVDQQQPQTSAAQPLRKMIFGGIGGVMAGLITYPNDTVRRLLQLQGSRGTNVQYAGYFDCVKKTYQAEGIGRFYRGILINIIRMAPNAAVQFGSYELLKQLTAKYF